MSVVRSARDAVPAYRTLDGSEIRELMHPGQQPVANQSLAEATVRPGQRTQLHCHRYSEELYYILAGQGRMTLAQERFEVRPGDTVLIPPQTAHCIENVGMEPLRILCCCAPAYAHTDTDIIQS